MNSNKIIPIMGLLIILILAIGFASASDADSESVGESANIDLNIEGAVIDDSNIIEEENTGHALANEETSNDAYGIEDIKNEGDVNNSLGSSPDNEILTSNVKFKESQYSTYFNGSGNIISGKLKAGDTLDFSGTFTNKMFIINIPLTITCTDGTVLLKDCGFRFISGSSGSNISNIKANQISVAQRPVIQAQGVTNLTFINNDIFSNQSGSYPMSFNNITGFKIFNNKLQCNAYSSTSGWGQPSAMVLRNAGNCNISGNTVITNDSNGIYFSGYGASSSMGTTPEDGSYGNYIFNNTVYSVRELPSSFCYAIVLMCKDNIVINNTIYNTFRAVSATSSGNQIIGNTIHNIHGAYYSQATNEEGADYAIYAASNSIVKENFIFDCNFNDTKKGGAICISQNSLVANNTVKNCTGIGVIVEGNSVNITENDFNVSGFGVSISGIHTDIIIESNVIDSNDQFSIRIVKESTRKFPQNILIRYNTLYSTCRQGAIYKDPLSASTVFLQGNTIIGTIQEEGQVDNETVHPIIESNFDDYFIMGELNTMKIKENDTLIFIGTFSSKGKLTINEKVTIQGANAVFKDTTFIVSEVDDVLIENIEISNPNTNLADRLWGIQIADSTNITIKNCNISIYDPYSAFAVYVLNSNDCRILNSSLNAEGNYFTAALFSFNSTNLLINGSSIETIGSGETYLINNRSCLNVLLNGATICPDGSIVCPDGTVYGPDECSEDEDGNIICPDGTTICPDGSTICADGTTICLDGSIICVDGTTICPDGTIICADGTTLAEGEYTVDEDGNIICPDGTTICVDGSGAIGELDGVIPGTHMISGLFRTYGALFVHTSNVNFTNNNVTVGSRLDPFYNLNESCNTIAGVFIHYGGFNNTISNNNINMESNDPVIYAMGIVGASPNSTAEGSKNNSFIDNNVSVKGPYYGVGIYLGYKALNSTFANNIKISAPKALEIINRTLVENDENNMDNDFEETTPLNTVLTVSNESYKWNNGNKFITVTLEDINENLVPNQNIILEVDGVNYTGKTDANGKVAIKVSINKAGTFDAVAYFYGEGVLLASTNAGKLVLTKDSTRMSSSGKTYTVTTASKTITVTLKDGSGNLVANRKVTATVNGKTVSATTNSKGVATFNLALNAVKTYTVSLKFAGDSYYTASSSSVKVKVTKTKTKLTVPKYTAKTNKKGVATVKVKLSKKKTYKFTVKFAGDKTYVAVKKTGKVKIK